MTTIGFIGTGVMSEAIIGGMLKGGFVPEDIWGADPDANRRAYMIAKYGIHITESNQALAAECGVLVMAVKPQVFPDAAASLRPALTPGHSILSIVTGITTGQLETELRCAELGRQACLPVIRAVPNTPAAVQAGVTCLCPGKSAGEADMDLAKEIFRTVGAVADAAEDYMDVATGVAGCGPAYIYMLIEALADGGVMMGMPRKLSLQLAAETVKGAAAMVLAGDAHPETLKDEVCTPGGATIAGVYALEKAGLRGAVMEAVRVGVEKCKRM